MGQSGFSSFYQLLNIRLMLRKIDFFDDRIAEMYRTETPQRGTAKAYSGLYKREFTEEDSEIRIIKDEKKRSLLTINGLSHCRLVRAEMETAYQPLTSAVKPKIPFLFHRCISAPTILSKKKITQERSLSLANLYPCK